MDAPRTDAQAKLVERIHQLASELVPHLTVEVQSEEKLLMLHAQLVAADHTFEHSAHFDWRDLAAGQDPEAEIRHAFRHFDVMFQRALANAAR